MAERWEKLGMTEAAWRDLVAERSIKLMEQGHSFTDNDVEDMCEDEILTLNYLEEMDFLRWLSQFDEATKEEMRNREGGAWAIWEAEKAEKNRS